MALNGGGDSLVATIALRERGKLESIGGVAYLNDLQNGVPSAENLDFYIPELRDSFRRRQILDASARLDILARDPGADSAAVLADTEAALEALRRQEDASALPDIISAPDLAETEVPIPQELVSGVLHQGSKLIVGGSSKSYKTWSLIDLALAVSTGSPWMGFNTTAGKVLYVNLEIQAGFFRRRLLDVAQAGGLELSSRLDTWNLRGWAADYRVLIPKIRTRVRDQGHALVIIDPTYKLLGTADENSATDISALLNMVENLAVTTGAAVVAPFVVRWDWPRFKRADTLDPTKLKRAGGRPPKHTADMVLACLSNQRLTTTEWEKLSMAETGMTRGRFFELFSALKEAGKVQRSVIDRRWEKIQTKSGNYEPYKDQ